MTNACPSFLLLVLRGTLIYCKDRFTLITIRDLFFLSFSHCLIYRSVNLLIDYVKDQITGLTLLIRTHA